MLTAGKDWYCQERLVDYQESLVDYQESLVDLRERAFPTISLDNMVVGGGIFCESTAGLFLNCTLRDEP